MAIKAEEEVRERFIKDVSGHSLMLCHDDGVFRHLVFHNNGSFNQRFAITTFPGHLAITGDMGDYVFARVDDMFGFFRRYDLKINSEYWAEKVVAISRHEGLRQFDLDKFRTTLTEEIEQYFEGVKDNRGADVSPAECLAAFEEDVMSYADDEGNEHDMRRHASEFEHGDFRFEELYEHSFTQFSYHFLWCLHAIVWGIQQYDAHKSDE
jgi:hypothetical protein